MRTIRSTALVSSVLLAALVVGACSDDGPSFPTSFEPTEMQGDLSVASAATNAPASASFSTLGEEIEDALSSAGGSGGLLIEAPAALLDGPMTPTARLRARLTRIARARAASGGSRMANAVPAEVLGTTFVWDVETSQYVASDVAGAPANGVRFALYAINPLTDLPAEPLNEIGYADLTVVGGSGEVTVRVQVWSEGITATRVLDYAAHVEGSLASLTVDVEGYAKNAQDSLAFTLKTNLSFENQVLSIDWRTSVPTRGLVTRLIQTLSGGEANQFLIDAAIVSPSGRVDLDGTITELTGGTLNVRVNGAMFATISVTSAEDREPTILNASGEPLSEAEGDVLEQIFDWFSDAVDVFFDLLGPTTEMFD